MTKKTIFDYYLRGRAESKKRDTYLAEHIGKYVDGEGKMTDNTNPVFITPALHFKPLGIETEEVFWRYLFNFLQSEAQTHRLSIGTAYLNFPVFLQTLMQQKHKHEIEVINASPLGNDYTQSSGFKKKFPIWIRQNTVECLLQQKAAGNNFKLREYERIMYFKEEVGALNDLGSLHFKGLWIHNLSDEFPRDTVIGSSNFTDRSFFKDFEV